MSNEIRTAVSEGNLYDIVDLLRESLESGIAPSAAMQAMLQGLQDCGQRFEDGLAFLPELTASGEAFKAGMRVLEPLLKETPRESQGTVVLGTVRGDVHDIGKNLVGFMLESSGFQVIDLGVDVSPDQFAAAVRDCSPVCLGLSALLTTTMLGMEKVVETLGREGLREKVKVIVGGAPVSQRFAEKIGADGYASDAPSGVRMVQTLLNKTRPEPA